MRLNRKGLAIAVFGVGMLGGGVAFGYFTTSGSGFGATHAGTSTNSVIAAGTSAADLFPGATKTVTVTVSNPNPYPVLVRAISAGSSDVVNTTCVAGTVTSDARPTDATGLQQSNTTKPIAPNGSGTYTLTTHMTTTAVDACRSQTFTLPLTATLSSTA
jgi:hypothetical protein